MFVIKEKYSHDNKKFNIYTHKLSFEELENNISELLFKDSILNYLFNGLMIKKIKDKRKKLCMLRRFIPSEFYYREKEVLDNWDNNKKIILDVFNNNNSYYSFYAEALMAYLNMKYLNQNLTFGVISLKDTLTDQHTGVDSCMFCDTDIILGEAKFYKNFNDARDKIINDFNDKSLLSKINSLYTNYTQSKIVFKCVGSTESQITFDEFKKKNITLCGFILHNKKTTYDYTSISNVNCLDKLENNNIVFYHLPINSKIDLIYKIIKKALELIVVYETK